MNIENKYCTKCGLHKHVNYPCLSGKGVHNPDVLVIVSHPIIDECKNNQIWISKSEAIVEQRLTSKGLSAYFTYALKCTPFMIDKTSKKVKKPTANEISMCTAHTIKLVQQLRPKVILCMGTVAMKQILGFSYSLTGTPGKVFYHPELDAHVVVTWDTIQILNEDTMYLEQFDTAIELVDSVVRRPKQRKITTAPRHLSDHYDIAKYLHELLTAEIFAFDLETTGTNPFKDRITDISFCHTVGQGVHILWADIQEHLPLFREVMASSVKKIGHNVAFDTLFLRTNSFIVNSVYWDTMLGAHMLSMSYEGKEIKSLYKLKMLAWHMTTEGGYETLLEGGIVEAQKKRYSKTVTEDSQGALFSADDLAQNMNKELDMINLELDGYADFVANTKKARIAKFNMEPVHFYSAMDSDVTLRLYYYMRKDIENNYSWIFNEIVMPLNDALTRMTQHGCLLDLDYMNKVYADNAAKMDELKKYIHESVGYEFNIDSSTQVADLMYKKLKLKPHKDFMTKGGKQGKPQPATDELALKHYSAEQPILKDIIEYRNHAKQNSTYIDGFKELMDDFNKIHPSFMQATTATGRLSGNSPNLQNIPRDNTIRNMIIAPNGHKIVSADLSQAELRILAMLANDTAMIDAFKSGKDFHMLTACSMFGIPIDKFDKHIKEHSEARTAAKCLDYDTRVPTEYGIIKIRNFVKDVPDVDMFKHLDHPIKIINPVGNYTEATQYYEGGLVEGNIVKLENGMLLKGSNDHKILTIKNDIITETALCNIKPGDIIACQGGVQDTLHVNPFFRDYLDIIGTDDYNVAMILLMYISTQATIQNNSLKFQLDNHDFTILLNILKVTTGIKKICGVDSNILYINNHELTNLIVRHNVICSGIPEVIWCSNKETAMHYIIALANKYGYTDGSKLHINLPVTLAEDLQQLLFIWFGILTDCMDHMVINYGSIDALSNELKSAMQDRLPLFELSANKNYTMFFIHDYMAYAQLKVVSVSKCEMPVADLFVPDGNKFNAAGIPNCNCINFGVAYQQSARALAFGLKNDYGIEISVEQAENFINMFYRTYPDVTRWIADTKKFALKHGYVDTIYGRRRYLPDVRSSLQHVREAALRRSINTPVQSAASDVACIGLIRITKWLLENNIPAHPFSIVHDDILIDTPDDYVDIVKNKLVECMTTGLPRITIPIVADPEVFTKWHKS